jgi:hypothetical protein
LTGGMSEKTLKTSEKREFLLETDHTMW